MKKNTAMGREYFDEWYFIVYNEEVNNSKSKEDALRITKLLDLDTKDTVLDLCCGWGRHIVHLSSLVEKVCGLDNSDFFLELAHEIRNSLNVANIGYVKSEMSDIPYPLGYFNKVYNLHTSFGYYDSDHKNQKVFAEVSRVLKRGGKFLLEMFNPVKYLNLKSVSIKKTLNTILESYGNDPIIRKLCVDTFKGGEYTITSEPVIHKTIKTVEQYRVIEYNGKLLKRITYRIMIYKLKELEEMLNSTGLTIKQIYGSLEGKVYNKDSDRLVLISEKCKDYGK
ncbi:MAG TPA: class I SAM-dependent methyltransferase [Bacteroidales bacterium]|nr:class I SAM-dependent methyltransferase [Bacteroidales bacterium]